MEDKHMTEKQINAFFEMVTILLGASTPLSDGAVKEIDEIAALARIGAAVQQKQEV